MAQRLDFFKKNTHLIYSIALIVIIPLAIIANTLIFLSYLRNNIDQELYNKAISIGAVINAGLADDLGQPEKIQAYLEKITAFNGEIASLDIINRQGEAFAIAASLDRTAVGKPLDSTQFLIAWQEEQPVAFLTNSASRSALDDQQVFRQNERFWHIVMPMNDSAGQKTALLSMKISLSVMDELTKQSIIKSYFILAITVAIIILLLINNTKLFEYAGLYRKLKEVDQMKDEFISMASHELRTPITGIKGYVSMLLEGNFGQLSDKAKSSLVIVEASAERLGNLVDDLLNVSRIEQGRLEIRLKAQNIEPIVKSVIEELSIQAQNKRLTLNYLPTANLPAIETDESHLKQILINIIGNAIKYTPQGSIKVEVKLSADGQALEIRVKDTGLGMSAKEREKLFQKFYRIKNDQTREITGTGLGLWITKELTGLMNGSISVDSIENVGTEMIVAFPVKA
jgi:signal transduction histidine kinase